jgi:hypothetical protein
MAKKPRGAIIVEYEARRARRATSRAAPLASAGARYERAAICAYLRRQLNALGEGAEASSLGPVLDWVLARQKRYDKRVGGLGRK